MPVTQHTGTPQLAAMFSVTAVVAVHACDTGVPAHACTRCTAVAPKPASATGYAPRASKGGANAVRSCIVQCMRMSHASR